MLLRRLHDLNEFWLNWVFFRDDLEESFLVLGHFIIEAFTVIFVQLLVAILDQLLLKLFKENLVANVHTMMAFYTFKP